MPALDEAEEKPLHLSIESFGLPFNARLVRNHEPGSKHFFNGGSNHGNHVNSKEESDNGQFYLGKNYKDSLAEKKKPESPSLTSGSTSSIAHKLPHIDISKNRNINLVWSKSSGRTNLPYVSRSKEHPQKLDRSPTYVANLDITGRHQDSPGPVGSQTRHATLAINQSTARNSTLAINQSTDTVIPLLTKVEDKNRFNLPNIFQHRKVNNFITSTSPITKSFVSTSRDSTPFLFKREPSFLSLSRNDLSLIGRQSKLSHRIEPNILQRSGTHFSPLLLPVHSRLNIPAKKKRTKKDEERNEIEDSVKERSLRENVETVEAGYVTSENPGEN